MAVDGKLKTRSTVPPGAVPALPRRPATRASIPSRALGAALALATACGGTRLAGGDGGALGPDGAPPADSSFVERSCPTGGCTVVTLIAGLPEPISLAVDEANVYWTDSSLDAVMSRPLDGGSETMLASGQSNPFRIAVQGTNLYWIAGPLSTMPVTGGSPRAISSGSRPPLQFALDETDICWTTLAPGFLPPSSLMVAPLAGGATTTIVGGQFCVGLDASKVFWSEGMNDAGGPGAILTAAIAGGAATTLYAGSDVPSYIVVDNGTIYGTGLAVTSRHVSGGSVTTLATLPGQALALDAQNVYWLDAGTSRGEVLSVPRAGGSVVTLASGRNKMEDIAVNSTAVYWTERAPGKIMTVVKP